MLKELFTAQQGYLNHFFDQLDLAEVEALLDRLNRCKGVIFFCGVGKSGLVAEKLAMTMVSLGIKSWNVPPTNALHGDLGIVSEGDIFIMLSKSGESEELLNLIPFVRNKGAMPIAWVCSEESRLEKACEIALHLPLERELCRFDMAPTTSDVLQLTMGNVLAVALMHERQLTLSEYAQNHPAGRIGRRITMRVEDLMLTGSALPKAAPDAKLVDQLVTLSDKKCGCLLVVNDQDEIEGLFTDGDLRRALQERGPEALEESLANLMTRSFREIAPKALAHEAKKLMEADQKAPITVLPVTEGGQVKGLIKLHDLIQSGL